MTNFDIQNFVFGGDFSNFVFDGYASEEKAAQEAARAAYAAGYRVACEGDDPAYLTLYGEGGETLYSQSAKRLGTVMGWADAHMSWPNGTTSFLEEIQNAAEAAACETAEADFEGKVIALALETARQVRGEAKLQDVPTLLHKFDTELGEFRAAVTRIDKVAEVADVWYYGTQLRHLFELEGHSHLAEMIRGKMASLIDEVVYSFSPSHARAATLAKYACRHEHGKNHELEAAAISAAIAELEISSGKAAERGSK